MNVFFRIVDAFGRSWRGGLAALAIWALASPVTWAGPTVSLSAHAHATVSNDEMMVTLALEREGPQVGPLNDQINRELAGALQQAHALAGIVARLSGMYTAPSLGTDGRIVGYRVRGEVQLRSQDFAALGQLAGTLAARMQVASVSFVVSDKLREAQQARLTKQAAEAFEARARTVAEAFGYQAFDIRTLSLEPGAVPMPRMFARPMAGTASRVPAPIVTEGGESEVVVSISGSVELR
jgi:predicted secreted protein